MAPRPGIVDAWIQHPTPSFIRHPMFAPLRRWMNIDEVPEAIPLELTLGALSSAGVEIGLCSAWWGPDGPLIPNHDVAEWVARAGGKLRGICSVDLRHPMDAVRQLRSAKEDGFVGVRVLPWLWEKPPNHRLYYPIYAACVELDLPFCLQVGHAGPLRPSEPGRPIPYLDDVAVDFPELTIVAGHVGYPWTEEMIALATKYPNVYIDTSAYKASRYPTTLVDFMRGRGRRKVLFGSNFPMITPAACLADLERLQLDAEATDLFLHRNARRVFRLEDCAPHDLTKGS